MTYKGALQGEGAHTVWIGDVLIRKEAEGTDTYEENRNLVLTDGAGPTRCPTSRSRPARSQGAGHASRDRPVRRRAAVLPASRGIAEDEARRLVVRGFFAELVRGSACRRSRERLIDTVEAELAETVGVAKAVTA